MAEEQVHQEEEYDSEVEAEICGSHLIARRILQAKPSTIEVDQRDKIFMTRVLVRDKLCNIIVDTSSCANVVSTTLVEKLNWSTK